MTGKEETNMDTTREHLDTLEIRVYGPTDEKDLGREDAIADAFNVALEQVKRDLAKLGLQVEADF